MQRHISELQQRDVMNISQVKELETKCVLYCLLSYSFLNTFS